MENDTDPVTERPKSERTGAERAATDCPKEYFSVSLTF